SGFGAMKKFLFFVLALLLIFCPAFAADVNNVTELRIEEMPLVVDAGTALNFSFSAGNRIGQECAAQIEYWIEGSGKTAGLSQGSAETFRLSQGSDTFFLGKGETKTAKGNLLVPSNASGMLSFFIKMQCNDATVLANKAIEAKEKMAAMPLFSDFSIKESGEGSQIEFNYTINSSQSGTVPFQVEEQILQDNSVFWRAEQKVPITGGISLNRFGPVLSPGNYALVVKAAYGSESAEVTRLFTVAPAAAPFPLLQALTAAALILLLFAAVVITTKLISPRMHLARQAAMLGGIAPGGSAAPVSMKKKRACIVQSESGGVADEFDLSQLLDAAGMPAKEREKCAEVAGRIPITQIVKGFILTDYSNRMSCETTVAITISNNTNRNWRNLVLLASIPDFLADDAGEIDADCEMQAIDGTPVVRFFFEKVGAMHSGLILYRVPLLVSQAEANSIALPAVISFEESKPLVITQVNVEKRAEKRAQKAGKKALIVKKIKSKNPAIGADELPGNALR
ncbi:MAG: hypothetical protein Q8N60_04125, partial [Candidatus Diapherotrites archaeon]|nr:hypothetical protein [Candidatus Diapherotrites archaeon]